MAEARAELAVLPAAFFGPEKMKKKKCATRGSSIQYRSADGPGGQRSRFIWNHFPFSKGIGPLVREAQLIQYAGKPCKIAQNRRDRGGVFRCGKAFTAADFQERRFSSEGDLLSDSLQAVGEVLHFIFRQTRLPGRAARGFSICHSAGHL